VSRFAPVNRKTLGALSDRGMRRSTRLAVIVVSVVTVLAAGSYLALRRLFPVATLTVIEKTSPDRTHTARLMTREAGFDVNVVLEVDDAVVYTSPDFAAPATADFQERVLWDRSGNVVLIEVAGKRFFGYDVLHRNALSMTELARVQLSSFEDLRFTEELPGATP